MTRSSSSTSSALSNINVRGDSREDHAESLRSEVSTPPTSCEPGSISPQTTAKLDSPGLKSTLNMSAERGARKRKSVNYNEHVQATAASSRNVSGLTGTTLVEEDNESDRRSTKKRKTRATFPEELPARIERRPSVKDRVKKVASKIGTALGKRKILKELDMGSGGLLDEVDIDAVEEAARPTKKLRKSNAIEKLTKADSVAKLPAKSVNRRREKQWLTAGLYVGQQHGENSKQKKLQKRAVTEQQKLSDVKRGAVMPLPMFEYLEKNSRNFTIPYDVFAPTFKKGDPKPTNWSQLNRNQLVGEAKELWENEAPLAMSLCICQPPSVPGERGCDDDCLNRVMHYECDKNNCALTPEQCGNRAFADLAHRTKKGGKFDIGVEIVQTSNRGFGIRACRVFAPGDIIMEYTGEIISEAECQRRMREIYANKQSYYIMEFDQGLHIDGTKGSMARFVNHSCEPNCEVRMVKVSGKPRMAIFASDSGVFTGEELTYDYNFDNFGEARQVCFCGAASCRGSLSRRLNATEQKLKDKEDKELREQAELEAKKHAAQEAKKKAAKDKRGSGWRGWATYAEALPELVKQKAAREEAEKNSSRSKRLASRLLGRN
ncbi:hypothetical protein AMS68_003843 [Peltaster fructicola]|uniref:Histone-lysine N-methyltransferase n=1 Tax=Peltaster fructicola TaxID=286661 RepID=A0A6H0XUG7_9PEZI|nr:hypothetical protein AMS68_003843 [Peltaster fructicola]